jgi:hypothetical protein
VFIPPLAAFPAFLIEELSFAEKEFSSRVGVSPAAAPFKRSEKKEKKKIEIKKVGN